MPAPTAPPAAEQPSAAGRMDRRQQARGDQRREALLLALHEHLMHSKLESISVGDIARKAGLTRPSFYFYFESKSVAVAALMEAPYAEMAAINVQLLDRTIGYRERTEAMIRGSVEVVERHQHLFRAMLAARADSDVIRELWDADRESFVPGIAHMIDEDRADGIAPPGISSTELASVLVQMNEQVLERLATDRATDRELLIRTAVHIWLNSVYATPVIGQVPQQPAESPMRR
jgi:TetR/AcrR family transcriptional regulator, ethionamide resistance regulator